MKKILSLLALVQFVVVPLVYAAESAPKFSHLSRSEFLKKYEAFGEEIWADTIKTYTRIDPSMEESIPGKEWQDEDREVFGCVYDELTKIGALDALDEAAQQSFKMAQAIRSDETITIKTMIKSGEMLGMEKTHEKMVEATTECGLMKLNLKRMTESGFMDKVRELYEE